MSNLCAARSAVGISLARLPRTRKTTCRYEGSNRYYRGRVLAVLREAPEEGIPMFELGEGLREGFGEEDMPWLRGVVESLEKDGLARVRSAQDYPQSVAEDRGAYGTGRLGGSPRTTTRVSLP